MTWSDLPHNPSPRTLRQFSGLWLLFFSGLGWQLLVQDRAWWGWLLLVLAWGAGIGGLIRPRLLRPIFVGWMMAVFPIGWTVSQLILGVIFYGVFTPLGLYFRLRGRDVLQRRRSAAASYWMTKPASAGAASYYHPF